MSVFKVGLVLAAIVAAAIAANVALLSVATGAHEPVGRLSPVVAIQPSTNTPPPSQPALPPAPLPTEPAHHIGEADD